MSPLNGGRPKLLDLTDSKSRSHKPKGSKAKGSKKTSQPSGKKRGKRTSTSPTKSTGGLIGAGRSTSDSVLGKKSDRKMVSLEVSVPKGLRKVIRKEAAAAGVTVDRVVGDALARWLSDPR